MQKIYEGDVNEQGQTYRIVFEVLRGKYMSLFSIGVPPSFPIFSTHDDEVIFRAFFIFIFI